MQSPVQRAALRLQKLLFSSRPDWALMPGWVAENFVESLLFTLSACEREGMRYTAHFGTLLGAHRLGGVAPWDEDADIHLLGEDRASVERKLGKVLDEHGFDLVWEPRWGIFWVRQRPWWAGQGHIALEFMPAAPHAYDGALPSWEGWIPPEQLLPLSRVPFHGSWIWGPADPAALLDRLYGEDGSAAAMARFERPRLDPATEAFWRAARGGAQGDGLDWPAISERLLRQLRRRPLAHLTTFPWWWFNGTYNNGIKSLRRLGKTLATRVDPDARDARDRGDA